ncbi:2970_t:CDS:2 [Dentiscutata heterogama]|uniref:2970_t:CDS:1 n=1 Tax=Dentiscutata heterogama TaxID=1316150 RepID=A0ACA9L305_9GLOM|nr:2970_t:CDS:2 [Dentiscutata heterogama]
MAQRNPPQIVNPVRPNPGNPGQPPNPAQQPAQQPNPAQQSSPNISAGFVPSPTTSESAIDKLTEAVNKMLTQLQDRRPTSGSFNRVVCYKCGKTGHISRNCRSPSVPNAPPNTPPNYAPLNSTYNPGQTPNPIVYPYPNLNPQHVPISTSSNHIPNPIPNNNITNNVNPNMGNAPELQPQEALQALLAMAASLNPSSTQNNSDNQNPSNNQTTFLNLFEEDLPFFTVKSNTSRPSKRLREEDEYLSDLSESTESPNTSDPILTKKQKYEIRLPKDWSLKSLIGTSSNSPLPLPIAAKLVKPLSTVGSRPISPVDIPLVHSSAPKVDRDINNCHSMHSIKIVPVEINNNAPPKTSIVSEPFKELEPYASRLKTQLGYSFKTLNNLSFASSSSSTPSLIVIPENVIVDILQPLSLNYIRKEISLPSPNFNNLPSLVYYKVPTSDSEVSFPLNRHLNSDCSNTLYTVQQNSLGTDSLTRNNKIVSPFIKAPDGNPPMIILENDSDESSNSDFEWYASAWKYRVPEYQFNENDSDADEIIDEIQRQIKLRKAKLKSPSAKCFYDLAGNAYLQEKDIKPDLRGYISIRPTKEEYNPIRDIFDYYFGEGISSRKNDFNIGNLEEEQYRLLQSFLEQNSTLFTWEGHRLGRTNLVKHSINAGNALPIKHHPYRHSPAEKKIIRTEIDRMIKEVKTFFELDHISEYGS